MFQIGVHALRRKALGGKESMRRKTFTKALAIVLSLVMIGTVNPVMANEEISAKKKQEVKKNENYAEGEAIILYNGTNVSTKSRMSTSLGNDIEITDTYVFEENNKSAKSGSVSGASGVSVSLVKSEKYSTEELINLLNKKSNIKYAEPNYKIKKLDYNDSYYKYQWGQDNKGQNAGTEGLDINADTELLADKDSEERVIALVDTGIDYTHEDLADVVWNNPYNNKKLYGEHGYDFINYDDDPMDDNGHGSHCSGIMAGKSDNDKGIVGTAKSENIKIMALKILDEDGYGWGMESVGAYNYIYKAQQLGINVVAVNNSWGGASEEESEILKTLIDMVGENGAISVCAAGNEATDNDEWESIPANIDSDYVISVAATNENDELASFSNYGKKTVDIAAPGTDILSSVSYDFFNPSIYENKEALCSTYQNFDTGNLVNTINKSGLTGESAAAEDIAYGTDSNGKGNVTVSTTDEEFFGTKDGSNKSLSWTVTDAESGSYHYLYLPYEVKKSKTDTYVSLSLKVNSSTSNEDDFGDFDDWDDFDWDDWFNESVLYITDYTLDENGQLEQNYIENNEIVDNSMEEVWIEQDNYWSVLSLPLAENINKDEKHVLILAIDAESAGDYSINIDNFGVSKENVSSSKFGKYDYYNGTSMATPHVTGAIAAVANAYPQENALQVKSRVLGSVRKTEELQEKVASGGVLDLSKVSNPSMFVEKASMNSKKQIEIKGYYMDDAEVYVNDKKVDVISNDGTKIIIDGQAYVNKQVTVRVEKDGVTYEESYFFSQGKAFTQGVEISGKMRGGQLLSSGNNMVYVDSCGLVSYAAPYTDQKTKKEAFQWSVGNKEFGAAIFGKQYEQTVDYSIYNDTEYVYTNGKIYGVLSIDVGYATDTILAVYDSEKGWMKLSDMPDGMDDLYGSTLAAYNGDLYLLGGMDENGNINKKVVKYSVSTKKWANAGNIPEARMGAKAVQVGKKLILTLGYSDKDETPKNLIYDGKSWTVSKADLGISPDEYFYGIDVTRAQIGLVSDGIIYTNLTVEGMGDTFTYNVNNDSFTSSQYALNAGQLTYDNLFATTVKDKLYVIYGDEYIEYDDEDEYWSTKSSYDSSYEDEDEGTINTLYIPITSGYVNVVDNSKAGAYVEGTGYYLPGDTITLKAVVTDKNKSVDKFLVNGKSIAKGKDGYVYTVNAADCSNKVTAQVVLASNGKTEVVTAPKLGKTKVSKATRTKKNKKIKITLKKITNAQGYQIKYSTSKKFGKKATKTINSKKLKVTLKKLKAKKKYYIKARAYITYNGKKVYGKWSNVKKVKVKKAKKSKKK